MGSSIYLIDFGDVIKVGFSRNVKQRISNISSQFDRECARYFSWETPFATEIEASVKTAFTHAAKPFKGVVNESFNPAAFIEIKEHIISAINSKAKVKKVTVDGVEVYPIAIYIQEHHNGNISAFARTQDVRYDQVTRWLKRRCLVVDGVVYCEVSKAKKKGLNNG